jgi:hypothetical protein
MSALGLIKEGILDQNWHKVAEGYKLLTGTHIFIDTHDIPISSTAIQVIDTSPVQTNVLTTEEIQSLDADEGIIDLDKRKSHRGIGSVKSKAVPFEIKKRQNTFVCPEATPEDIKFDKLVRTPQALEQHENIKSRPPAKKYKITCSTCGKAVILEDLSLLPRKAADDDESPAFVCDKCILRRRHEQ